VTGYQPALSGRGPHVSDVDDIIDRQASPAELARVAAVIASDFRFAPRTTPISKLEAALKCRSCGTRRYKPPVHMIKLTQDREIAPYVWVHPDDDDRH
jgi:hypothetical protein